MSLIWFCLMLASFGTMLAINPGGVLQTMLASSASSLTLCLNLCSIYAVWLGFMEILEQSGLADKIAKLMSPLIKRLFKTKSKETQKYIAINLSANLLGLGSVATPAGIEAMKSLENETTNRPSYSMIMLFVIASTSIQILPSTVIALRGSFGAINPSDVFVPTLISTFVTTFLGVMFVFVINLIIKRRKKICQHI